MKISKIGIFVLISLCAMVASSCTYYYRIMARKSLVDGAKAYNEREFEEAEELFKRAIGYDEELNTFEGRTAQLFLARTLHSEFASDRTLKKVAEEAIVEYKKALTGFQADLEEKRTAATADPNNEEAKTALEQSERNVGSIVSAVANLFENLQQNDKWLEWQTNQAKNDKLPALTRANAYISLGAKQYTCANEISDADGVKSTVTKDGEQVFEFTKPEDEEDFDKLKKCVEQGTEFIDQAIKLNSESDSAWSYRTSLLVQKARIAEMNGDNESSEKYKKESDEAKKTFQKLNEKRRKAEEEEAKKAAEEKAKEIGGKSEGDEAKSEDENSSEN